MKSKSRSRLYWMPVNIEQFMSTTAHLSTSERGAYLLLQMTYWTNGGLPNDDTRLARIVGMTPEEWRAARPTLEEFFQPGWRHAHLDAEREKADGISDKRRQAAHAMHANRYASAVANADATEGADASANVDANAVHLHTQLQPQQPPPSPEGNFPASPASVAPRADAAPSKAQVFELGRAILNSNKGGILAKLLKERSTAEAMQVLTEAASTDDPRQAIIEAIGYDGLTR